MHNTQCTIHNIQYIMHKTKETCELRLKFTSFARSRLCCRICVDIRAVVSYVCVCVCVCVCVWTVCANEMHNTRHSTTPLPYLTSTTSWSFRTSRRWAMLKYETKQIAVVAHTRTSCWESNIASCSLEASASASCSSAARWSSSSWIPVIEGSSRDIHIHATRS